ncbi:hypothetical protein Tco_0404704 [Tanacetum coccineum]
MNLVMTLRAVDLTPNMRLTSGALLVQCFRDAWAVVNGYIKYGQKRSKTDKTEHGNGRVQEIEAECIYILNGPTRTHFNGPGSRLKTGERLRTLDPSNPHYKRRTPHTEMDM